MNNNKPQIVPALASAVHGAIEEIITITPYENTSPKSIHNNNRSRLTSSSSSTKTDPIITATPKLLNSNHQNQTTRATPEYFQIPSNTPSSQSSTITQMSSNHFLSTPMDVRRAFTYFDKNHDGKVDVKEFKSVMRQLGYKQFDKKFIQRMFAEADRNKNGVLELDEFVEFLESKFSMASIDNINEEYDGGNKNRTMTISTIQQHYDNNNKIQFDIETLFNCYDLDKNGYIEPKELRKVMEKLLGEKLSKQDIDEMMKLGDTNGDGLLDKNEFAVLCSAF